MAKVLLVEDDNNLREIYEARLQAEGYEISSAQDGEQALVVAKQFKPDLIISDVMMPKISGFEMLDILRNTEGLQSTRVIMLTALGQAEDKSRADSLGADRYLVKSQVTLEDIVKAAHEILDEPGSVPATVAAAEPTAVPPAAPAPAPAAEPTTVPVAVAPAPEPAADPAPTTPDPTSDPIATAAVMNPVSEPATAPAEPAASVDDATAGPTPTEANDQLVAEAAQNLNVTDPAPTEPAPAIKATSQGLPLNNSDSARENTTTANNSDVVTIAHKKVIEPINATTKPDLNELLAKEEAASGAAPALQPVVADMTADATASVPEAESVAPPHQPGDSFTPQAEPVVPAEAPAATPGPTPEPAPAPEAPAQPPAQQPAGDADPDSIAL
jgi:CheY-like chemotaxis protein